MSTATIPTTVAAQDEPMLLQALLRIPIGLVRPGRNARADLGDLTELAASIRKYGMQVPMHVIQLPDGGYEVFDGHRRLAAARKAGVEYVLAMLRRPLAEVDRLRRQVDIHAHRQQLNPMDEAWAFHQLMFEHNQSREQIAAAVHKPPTYVRDRIALTRLTPAEQAQVRAGRLTIGEALALVAQRRAQQAGGSTQQPARSPVRSRVRYFTRQHPLAAAAAALCHQAGRDHRAEHELIGQVACGQHWEEAIRADAAGGGSDA